MLFLFFKKNRNNVSVSLLNSNLSQILTPLFLLLQQIPVVECNSNRDCYDVGTGICGPVKGIPNTENICQLTR